MSVSYSEAADTAVFIHKTGKMGRAQFSGMLEIGSNLKIPCNVYTKVSMHGSIFLINPLPPANSTYLCCGNLNFSFMISLGDRFCVTRKGGHGDVGGCTQRVQNTWTILGLAVRSPWLELGRQFHSPYSVNCMTARYKHGTNYSNKMDPLP